MKLANILPYLLTSWTTAIAVDTLITTNQGSVRGTALNDKVTGFLGIPYAEPPVGPLRFRPPQPLECQAPGAPRSRKPLDATKFGPVCHQFNYRTVLGDTLLSTSGQSEDCLTLNVFVPSRARRRNRLLPVFIWSYGGAFGEGGGSTALLNPTGFVADNKDIIVVTWNYRVNLFGFPNSPALDAQNLGIRDQRIALEWLRDNIASFGGDPKHMILGGQSSGADTGHGMLYTHADDPIVVGIALQSGTVQVIGAATQNVDGEFVRIAKSVGCANSSNRHKELQCMQGIDTGVLKRAMSNSTFNHFGSPPGGSPMVDNVTLFTKDEYLRRGTAGHFAKIPTLMGHLNNEGDSVLNWSEDRGINKTFSDIITTTLFNCNMALEAGFRSRNGVPVWRYRYMGVIPEVTPYPWLGAYHLADVPLLIGTIEKVAALTNRRISPQTRQVSRMWQDVFATFIRDPARGIERKHHWPMFEPNSTTLVELFRNNSATASLVDPGKYDDICKNPPRIPWEEF